MSGAPAFPTGQVVAALDQAGGNKAEAARLLGVDYKTYRTKLKALAQQNGARADA